MDENTNAKITEIWEDFQQNNTTGVEPLNIKYRAVKYLRKKVFGKLSRRDMRRLYAKIRKMKNSVEKAEKARDIELEKKLQRAIKL